MEQYMQQIHELKRSLALEKADKEYMSAELETIHAAHDQQKADLIRKHHLEVEKFRLEIDELKNQNLSLEDDRLSQIAELKCQIEALKNTQPVIIQTQLDTSTTNHHLEQIQELSDKLQDFEDQTCTLNQENVSLRQSLDNAKEKIDCLEENLRSKKEEVEEKDQIIHELRTQLMAFEVEPDPADCNKKGNSLFAEVIDQRAQVVTMLAAQNRSYNEMKRLYTESEGQIRQLKEENALMVKEMRKIESIFLGAQKTHTEQLHKRIEELNRGMERANKKIRSLEELKGNQVVVAYEIYRHELETMRDDLAKSRMERCVLSEDLQAAQQELAQWRFACLKQKCVLIDRELRLEMNNIPFESRCSVPVDESVRVTLDNHLTVSAAALGLSEAKEDEAEDDCEIVAETRSRGEEECVPVIDLSETMEVPQKEPRNESMAVDSESGTTRNEEEEEVGDLAAVTEVPVVREKIKEEAVSPVTEETVVSFAECHSQKEQEEKEEKGEEVKGEENKENERVKPRKSSVTKLNYKAINTKSILVKSGQEHHQQKSVHFEEKSSAAGQKGLAVKQEPNWGEGGRRLVLKKDMKVNFRRVHSKPRQGEKTEGQQ